MPHSALAAANLAELACHVGNRVELPNQNQQKIFADLMGHPVQGCCFVVIVAFYFEVAKKVT